MLTALMAITLMAVVGFQIYWLKDNYLREYLWLRITMTSSFQETVRDMELGKLQQDSSIKTDTLERTVRMVMANEAGSEKKIRIKTINSTEVITTLNNIKKTGPDSVQSNIANVLIRTGNDSINTDTQAAKFSEKFSLKRRVFGFVAGVDSLKDSLKVADITKAYRATLAKEKLPVPFTVEKVDEDSLPDEPSLSIITVGFTKPVTYRLNIGDNKTYLFKKLTKPILFSIFLVGIVALSFWLVYKTILKQQRLAIIKNEFISNITHELKTPIATVGVAIEALQKFNAMDDPQKTKEYLDISSNELQRLGLLVDKVLRLSMLEKKEIELKFEETDIKQVVEEVTASMKLQFEKANATVSINHTGNTVLEADRLHLLSVVYNLLDNAIKYASEKPAISIGIKELENQIQLTVKDNGIGIPAEYKDKVFEKFFRVPAGDTHNAKGYGLGLSYVQHIIQQHHGSIEVNSEEGKGSQFIIKLPKQHGH